jgi:hypothetical protein
VNIAKITSGGNSIAELTVSGNFGKMDLQLALVGLDNNPYIAGSKVQEVMFP